MQGAYAQAIFFVLGLALSSAAFIGIVLVANVLLSPRKPNSEKGTPYECGMEQAGEPWASPRLRFSTIAVLFVLFDAETVLLFAVVASLRSNPIAAIEVGAFVFFLAFGLVYAWRKGALEWRS